MYDSKQTCCIYLYLESWIEQTEESLSFEYSDFLTAEEERKNEDGDAKHRKIV